MPKNNDLGIDPLEAAIHHAREVLDDLLVRRIRRDASQILDIMIPKLKRIKYPYRVVFAITRGPECREEIGCRPFHEDESLPCNWNTLPHKLWRRYARQQGKARLLDGLFRCATNAPLAIYTGTSLG